MNVWPGPLPDPEIRMLEDMREVLADPSCSCQGPLYLMFRDLALTARDRRWLVRQHLRYDITRIPARTICGEYVKTKGHFHPPSPSGIDYPEIYEVLEGTAHFLLQGREGKDVMVVEALAGQKVIVPPGYGHVTINPGSGALTMANIVSTAFSSDYAPFVQNGGAAYFEMEGEVFVKNPRYTRFPSLRRGRALAPGNGIIPTDATLYELVGNLQALAFLNLPAEYLEFFARVAED